MSMTAWLRRGSTVRPARLVISLERPAAILGGVWIMAAAGATLRSIHGNPYWKTNVDFGLYLRSGQELAAGRDPYLLRDVVDGIQHSFAYGPVFALAMAAFQLLPDLAGRYVWAAMVFGCMVATCALLLRGFRVTIPWGWTIFITGWIAASDVARSEVYHGQFGFVLALMLVASVWCLSRGRLAASGLLAGLLVAVKPNHAPLLFYYAWRRSWASLVAAAAASLAGTMVAWCAIAVVSDPEAARHWADNLRTYSANEFAASSYNLGVRGVLVRLLAETRSAIPVVESPALLAATSALAIVALGTPVLWAFGAPDARRQSDPWLLVEFSLASLAALTFGPLTEGSHVLVLLPGGAGLLLAYVSGDRSVPTRIALAAWGLLLAGFFSPVPALSFGNPSILISHPTGWEGALTATTALMLVLTTYGTCFAAHRRPD